MQLLASLADWLRELRAHRLRTASTMMGVAWGTFGVIGILAFGHGLAELMRERAAGIGKGVVIAWGQQTSRPFAGYPAGRRILLTEEDVLDLPQQVPELEAVSPEYVDYDRVQKGERVFVVPICGVHPQYAGLRTMVPQPGGRFLDERDLREERRVAFLGDALARQLFGDEDAIGKTVTLRGTPFTVVGVLRPKIQDNDYEGLDEGKVFVPASTYRRVFGNRLIEYFTFAARERRLTAAATAGIYRALGQRLQFDPTDRETLALIDTTEYDRIRETAFQAMEVLIGLACVFTLLVGGIGVGNLMFLLVRRRTRVIGIRMALGARPRWILQEVLVQALILVAAGGMAGFLAAWALCLAIGASPLREVLGRPAVSLEHALGTVALLTVIGLAAGWFPARRAARLDPVRALAE